MNFKNIRLLNNYSKFQLKLTLLLINTIVFSILYGLLDSSHFTGVNPIQDKIKDDIVENEVDKDSENIDEGYKGIISYKELFTNDENRDKEDIVKEVKNVVEDDEKKLERPTSIQRYFDSFYFSTITACLLGSGDIHPATNTVKFLVCCQTLSTICLILY